VDRSGALQAGLKEEQTLWNDEELSVNNTRDSRERRCTRGHNDVRIKSGKNIRKVQSK
jgi:hypothetical protein